MNDPPRVPATTIDLSIDLEGLSRHTRRAYLRHLRRYLAEAYRLQPSQIDIYRLPVDMARPALTPLILRTHLGARKTAGLSLSTLVQIRSAILWLASVLVDLNYMEAAAIDALQRVRMPKAETGRHSGKWLTATEINALLAAVPRVPKLTPNAILRNVAVVMLIATTGLRREEVATALWSDLVKVGGHWVLLVHGKGERIRHVKLPPAALEAINRWADQHPLPEGERPIFTQLWKGGLVTTGGLSPKAIWEIVVAAAQTAGLPEVSPHVLRRTFARGAFEAGASFELIRQTLGHVSVVSTERYVNAALELDRAAPDVIADGLED